VSTYSQNGWGGAVTKKTIYRSSETGRIVRKQYAETHKATAEKEHVRAK